MSSPSDMSCNFSKRAMKSPAWAILNVQTLRSAFHLRPSVPLIRFMSALRSCGLAKYGVLTTSMVFFSNVTVVLPFSFVAVTLSIATSACSFRWSSTYQPTCSIALMTATIVFLSTLIVHSLSRPSNLDAGKGAANLIA